MRGRPRTSSRVGPRRAADPLVTKVPAARRLELRVGVCLIAIPVFG